MERTLPHGIRWLELAPSEKSEGDRLYEIVLEHLDAWKKGSPPKMPLVSISFRSLPDGTSLTTVDDRVLAYLGFLLDLEGWEITKQDNAPALMMAIDMTWELRLKGAKILR